MFGRKSKCERCKSKVNKDFEFCPHCGLSLSDPEKDMKDFGMLGKNEMVGYPLIGGGGFGISDRMLNAMVRNLFKAFDKHMQELNLTSNGFPNRIRIKFGTFDEKKKKKNGEVISEEQIKRMTGLPRVEGKTNVKRLNDKVIYEIQAPGIEDVNDVFVSKLEGGYEIKAIGKKKVYVNSLPVNLPLKSYSITEKGLIVEFGLE